MINQRMNRRDFLARTGQAAFAGAAALTATAGLARRAFGQAGPPPNIIHFLVDDMGWTDWEGNLSPLYESPAMLRLQQEGMRFTNAYAASPLCSATRASLMTGKYPHRVRLTGAIVCPPSNCTENYDPVVPATGPDWARVTIPQFRTHLPLEERTIAEALKDAGYDTVHIGKWHMGNETWWPDQNGFDLNIGGGHYPGPPSYFSPYNITTLTNGPDGEYITDRLTDEALSYIENHQSSPFYMSFWHYAVHGPWQAKQDLIDKYEALVDEDGHHRDATYAAMLESMDQSLGRLLDKLDELGMSDNTIVVFSSDNGGLNETNGVSPNYIGSNAPLRGGKAMIYEGGTRVPMLVKWPGVVAPGSINATPVSSVDYYPTFLEAAGGSLEPGQVIDGESLIPLLAGTGPLARDAIYCHFPHYILDATPPGEVGNDYFWNTPSTWMRKGDWKLIRFYGEGATNEQPRHELYNLAEDLGEQHDLALEYPAILARMAAEMDTHLSVSGALIPLANPSYSLAINGWAPTKNVELSVIDNILHIEATGVDPILTGPSFSHTAPVRVDVRLRTATQPTLQVFWSTGSEGGFAGDRRIDQPLAMTGDWELQQVSLPVTAPETVTRIRLDPGGGAGQMDIEYIRIVQDDGSETILEEWTFDPVAVPVEIDGWRAGNNAAITEGPGVLHVEMSGADPQIYSPKFNRYGPLRVRMRMRCEGSGAVQVYWAEGASYTFAGQRLVELDVTHDGEFREYTFDLPADPEAQVIQMRIDPGSAAGTCDIDYVRVYRIAVPSSIGDQLIFTWDFGLQVAGVGNEAGRWRYY